MTKNEMRAILLRRTGVGVEVTTITGDVYYLFYEDFENDNGVERAQKHLCRGEKLVFFSNLWAQQSQFKEYMDHYKELCAIERKDPENPALEGMQMFKRFITKRLMAWTGCSYKAAKMQIFLKVINYSSFTGRVAV